MRPGFTGTVPVFGVFVPCPDRFCKMLILSRFLNKRSGKYFYAW